MLDAWANPAHARADVFSLGVMAYEMLLARLPYGGGSFIDTGCHSLDLFLHLLGEELTLQTLRLAPCPVLAVASEWAALPRRLPRLLGEGGGTRAGIEQLIRTLPSLLERSATGTH